MAFEALTERLQNIFRKVRGFGKLTEANIKDMMREIRLALLEADVNYEVVKEFLKNIEQKALGEEVLKSLTPGEMLVKIVRDELIKLLGEKEAPLIFGKNRTITLLIGLQGSGKTTTAGKLANFVRKKYNKHPLLIAADIYRPAAREQLITVGKSLDIPVYSEEKTNLKEIITKGLEYAETNNYDYIIIDTAGRLTIDEEMMEELEEIKKLTNPEEILLVVDAMMGQDAALVAKSFHERLNITGSILTKLDGDARGGAALSIRHITNVPIKFVGTGEKLTDLDYFYPERMARRILGMGDILSLVEKAEETIKEEEAIDLAKKLKSGKFDLEDFLFELKQIKKMGPLENIIKMLPGASNLGLDKVNIDPKKLSQIEAIINSMTKEERRNPEIIKASRKIRIAKGSGTTVEEVNLLLRRFEEMKKMMKMLKNNPLLSRILKK